MTRPVRAAMGRTERIPRTEPSSSGSLFKAWRSRDEPGLNRKRTLLGTPVLVELPHGGFGQAWIFGVDGGGESGLTPRETESLHRFYEDGGGIMLTRDHHDMGCALVRIGDVGAVHCFQMVLPEEDESRRRADDDNAEIGWPNYHSGKNGAFQAIEPVDPRHPLLEGVRLLPAHPHEGALRTPVGGAGRAVARGRSQKTGNDFILVVAFGHPPAEGRPPRRAVAHSSFHHFADYNLDVSAGAPSFVIDPVASPEEVAPEGPAEARRYWTNLALWLSERREQGGAR